MTALLLGAALYCLSGCALAAFLVAGGIVRIDPLFRVSSVGARLIIAPGLVLFWPLFAVRLVRGREAPEMASPHRGEPGTP